MNTAGDCYVLSKAMASRQPELRLVRGWYYCPIWGKRQHWWCVDGNGKISDPTAAQFPSNGFGEYEEFNGIVMCAQCGKTGKEEDFHNAGNGMVFCSDECYVRCVGLSFSPPRSEPQALNGEN